MKSRCIGKWTITKPTNDGSCGYTTYETSDVAEVRAAGRHGWGISQHIEVDFGDDPTINDRSLEEAAVVGYTRDAAPEKSQAVALSEKERERFEAWALGAFELAALPTRHGEGYSLTGVDDAWEVWKARAALSAPASKSAENRPAQDDVRDAQRYRALKTFAHHSYNQKVVSNAHSPSWRKEQLITVQAGSWEELDAAIDAAIASQSAKEPR